MKLLAIEESKLTALFQATRLQGQLYMPSGAAKLIERYSFVGYPQSIDELGAERVEFRHGALRDVAIDRLEIFSDGVVITSRSDTDILDAFLSDLVDWCSSDLGFTFVESRTVNRMYESQVIVEIDEAVLAPLGTFSEAASQIDAYLLSNSKLASSHTPIGFTLATDVSRNPDLRPAMFRLERRMAAEFRFNQFFSLAPLKTTQHLLILKGIEKKFRAPTA